ncbi:hypothetical protein [Allocoleopsis sp.]|uniref:hypothetical protein n=1 Tax=Allocoleopsis sp. TaxID=3088169 RepID=UPI002FD5741E
MTEPKVLEVGNLNLSIVDKSKIKDYINECIQEDKWGQDSDLVQICIDFIGKPLKVYASWLTLQCIFLDLSHPEMSVLEMRTFGLDYATERMEMGKASILSAIDHCLIAPSEIIDTATDCCLPIPLALMNVSDTMLKWKTFGTLPALLVESAVLIEMGFSELIKKKAFWRFEQFLANRTAKWLSDQTVNTPLVGRRSYVSPEKKVQKRLAIQLAGRTEVSTPSGSIDILTATDVIEIKHFSQWKSAVGQVLAYQLHFPDRGRRIHLFGAKEINTNTKNTIALVCDNLDIVVTYE